MTQAGLRSAGVTTIEELAAKVPSFNESDVALAPWIPGRQQVSSLGSHSPTPMTPVRPRAGAGVFSWTCSVFGSARIFPTRANSWDKLPINSIEHTVNFGIKCKTGRG